MRLEPFPCILARTVKQILVSSISVTFSFEIPVPVLYSIHSTHQIYPKHFHVIFWIGLENSKFSLNKKLSKRVPQIKENYENHFTESEAPSKRSKRVQSGSWEPKVRDCQMINTRIRRSNKFQKRSSVVLNENLFFQ